MERIIHFTVASEITQEQEQAIALARALNPGWDIRVWVDPVDFDGALLQHWYDRPRTGAGRADLIRLDVVYQFGGVYLDTDVFLQQSLEPLSDLDHFFCSEDGWVITNAAFGARKGHPALRALIDDLLANEPSWDLAPNVTTGPCFFAKILHWWEGLVVLPRDTFYPYLWSESPAESIPTTFGVHRWAHSWGVPGELSRWQSIKEWLSDSWSAFRRRLRLRTRIRAVLRVGLGRRYRYLRELRARTFSSRKPARSVSMYSSAGTLTVKTLHGFIISLPSDDLSITPHVAASGTYEPTELDFIRRALRGGDLMVDVGCNVGMHTLTAAGVVGPFGRVVAFDPNPIVLHHLRDSLAINWLHDRVQVEQVAIGEVAGTAEFSFPTRRFGDGSLVREDHSSHASLRRLIGSDGRASVQVVTLDERFPLDVEIKVLKIDVEGHDYAVLRGARRLFKNRAVAHLLIEALREVAPQAYLALMAELELIESFGYGVRMLKSGGSLSQPFTVEALQSGLAKHGRNLVLSRQ
jgi:FkbM family methyltransferase